MRGCYVCVPPQASPLAMAASPAPAMASPGGVKASIATSFVDASTSDWIRTTHVGSLPRPADGDIMAVIRLQVRPGLCTKI